MDDPTTRRADAFPPPRPARAAGVRWLAALAAASLAACATRPPADADPAPPATADGPATGAAIASPPGFTLAADSLDAWNAVGQLVVASHDIRLEGRAQRLDLHAVRFRGQGLLVLTHAVPLSDAVAMPTTRVTVVAQDGTASDATAAGVLLQVLREALPAEVARVRARPAPRQP